MASAVRAVLRTAVALAALTVVTLVNTPDAEAATTIRIATLAPKASAWGKGFSKWKRYLEKKTKGEIELRVYYNGVQGDDSAMVSKMKSGQLDAAALSSVGLSHIYKNVMVLQLPGVMDSWSVLDRVRSRMRRKMERGFEKKGFSIMGWGDLGRVRQMSKGAAVRTPADMRNMKPAVWRNEPMSPVVFAEIGGVTPVPLSVPEVLPALRSKRVNVMSAPALAAEALQWTAQMDHIAADSSVCAIGGSVMVKSVRDGLAADLRKTFDRVQKKVEKKQTRRIRKLDKKSYLRLKRKMKVVRLTDAERAEWEKVLRASIKKLGQGTFPKDLVEEVVRISGKK